MKKLIYALLCVAIIYSLSIPFALPTQAATTIYVPDDYSSIQESQSIVPLYRWWFYDATSNNVDHFYTTDPTGELAPTSGYVSEGIQCYVATTQIPGTTPLYRWWNPEIVDHFYTTNPSGEFAPTSGYVYEFIQCYVATTQIPGTTPLYRYWHPVPIGDHVYTTDPDNEILFGYVYQGIACYVWTSDQPPVASFTYSPENPTVGEEITFDASSSYDPDGGSIVSYNWDFGDGNIAEGEVVTQAYANAGDYTSGLTIMGNDGLTDTVTQTIQVRKCLDIEIVDTISGPIAPCTNFAIKAKITNRCNTTLDNVAGQISWSGPADGPVGGDLITWSLGSLEPGEMYVVAWTLHYTGPGEVIVYVTDPNHAEIVNPINNPWTLSSGQPPVASFKSWNIEDIGTNEPARIEGHHIVGGQIEFDARESKDPAGGTLTYYWDFGDGTQEIPSNPVYIKVFDKPEKVTVTLIVKNDKGIPSTNSSSEELDLSLKPGDLIVIRSGWPYAQIFDFFGLTYTHIGMYIGEIDGVPKVVETTALPPPGSSKTGVQETPISRWGYPIEKYVDVVRVTSDPEIAARAVAFARAMAASPHGYDTWLSGKQVDSSGLDGINIPQGYTPLGSSYYCSELIWAAYYRASDGAIDLSDHAARPFTVAVSPDDILHHPLLTSVGWHHEKYPPKNVGALSISALSPVDISVTDPSGLTITKGSSQIQDAAYIETHLDEDNDIDDAVIIAVPKIGDYSIQVIPDPSALPEDTYSLHVAVGEEYIVLANNVPISEIPEGGYAIQSTEGGINAVPIAEANGPYIGAKGASIAFDSSGSYDPDGTISSYIWDFGDGSGGTGASLIHVYNCPGVYTITLSVIDDDGDVGTDTATVTVTPQPMKSFVIKNLAIQWAPHRPGWQGSDAFSIFGRLQLPQGYTWASLEKQAIVTISIADKSGNDTVVFEGKLFGKPQSTIWSYRGSEQPPGYGMDIANMVMWWTPQGINWNGWAGFYIGGMLQLPASIGVSTTPANVKVTLEIPLTAAAGCGSLVGQQTVTCKVYKPLNLWTYNAWPNLQTFPWDPTGKE